MTDADDRMDRAERIRRMRETREPGEDHETTDDNEGADDTGTADGDEPAADDVPAADDGEGADGGVTAADDANPAKDDDTPAAEDGVESDESSMDETTSSDETDDSEMANGGSSEETDDTQYLMTESGAEERRTTEVSAQAARAETDGVGARPASGDEPAAPTNGVQQAASAGANGETATSEAVAPLGGSAGFSLPGEEELAAAADSTAAPVDDEDVTSGAARSRGSVGAATEPSVRVLEFVVGDQVYCIDIEEVEEIVKRESVTRVPNTEAYVEGVVDLRGQITTILDTKQLLDVDVEGPESLLVIFAPDAFEEHGTVGWVVDEVRQVVPVMDSQVRTAPSDAEYVRGVVDRDDEDELVVWIRPGDAMASAVAVGNDD